MPQLEDFVRKPNWVDTTAKGPQRPGPDLSPDLQQPRALRTVVVKEATARRALVNFLTEPGGYRPEVHYVGIINKTGGELLPVLI